MAEAVSVKTIICHRTFPFFIEIPKEGERRTLMSEGSKASSLQHMPGGSFLTACGISYSEVRSDVQEVAGGKFLCVGDRRNRENCERT